MSLLLGVVLRRFLCYDSNNQLYMLRLTMGKFEGTQLRVVMT